MRTSAVVIAVDGIPRNSSLLSALKSLNLSLEPEVIKACTPDTVDPELLEEKRKSSTFLLSRKVGNIEISIMLSHYKAYQYALSNDIDLLYVFEDDVVFKDSSQIESSLRAEIEMGKPCITLFYSPFWSIWANLGKKWRAVILPPFASAYAINRDAMQLGVNKTPSGLADWPTWTKKSYFYFHPSENIECMSYESMVEQERKESKLIRSYRLLFWKNPYKSQFSKCEQLTYSVMDPFIWKTINLIMNREDRKSNKTIYLKC